MLKEFKAELSETLRDIISVSFSKGIFPHCLKVENVVLVHKKVKKQTLIITDTCPFYPI